MGSPTATSCISASLIEGRGGRSLFRGLSARSPHVSANRIESRNRPDCQATPSVPRLLSFHAVVPNLARGRGLARGSRTFEDRMGTQGWRRARGLDVLSVEGEGFRKLPLEVRRAQLEALIEPDGAIIFSEAIEAVTGRCGGRKSYAERSPAMVALAKKLAPPRARLRSLAATACGRSPDSERVRRGEPQALRGGGPRAHDWLNEHAPEVRPREKIRALAGLAPAFRTILGFFRR